MKSIFYFYFLFNLHAIHLLQMEILLISESFCLRREHYLREEKS